MKSYPSRCCEAKPVQSQQSYSQIQSSLCPLHTISVKWFISLDCYWIIGLRAGHIRHSHSKIVHENMQEWHTLGMLSNLVIMLSFKSVRVVFPFFFFFSSLNYKMLPLKINMWAEAWGEMKKTAYCLLCFIALQCRAGHISPAYYQDDSWWPPCHRRVLDINKRLLRHPVINIRMVSVPNIICLCNHSFDQTKH